MSGLEQNGGADMFFGDQYVSLGRLIMRDLRFCLENANHLLK